MKVTFEYIKRVARRRTGVQTMGKKDKRTNNDLQNTTQKTKKLSATGPIKNLNSDALEG